MKKKDIDDTERGTRIRLRAKAQGNALRRLKEARPEEYRRYYKEEVSRAFVSEGLPDPYATGTD